MRSIKSVGNRKIAPRVLAGVLRNSLRNPKALRYSVLRSVWNILKRHAASSVENIQVHEIAGIEKVSVSLNVTSHDRAVLCAIAKLIQPKLFFEIGTYLGETTLAIARNNPKTKIFTLDLPTPEARRDAALEMTDEYLFQRWERGSAFKGTIESERIQQLTGDSATFDFTPYEGKIDLVFIDASHSYSYVRADTEAALRIIPPTGTILWHDYPAYPGVFAYLNELGAHLDRKIYHIIGTGLAFLSSKDLVRC